MSVRKGLMTQINDEFPYCEKKLTTLTPIEVGEYSIYVKKDLKKTFAIKVYGVKSKEIFSSPEGSIIYFDEKVPKRVKAGKSLQVILLSPITLTMQDLIEFTKEVFTNEKSRNNGL
jgi:hypothetical protein